MGVTLRPKSTRHRRAGTTDPGSENFYSSMAYEAIYHSPVSSAYRFSAQQQAGSGFTEYHLGENLIEGVGNQRFKMEHGVMLTPDQANNLYGLDGHLNFDQSVNSVEAGLLYDRKLAEIRRQTILEQGNTGFVRPLVGFGVNMVATALDPVNLASMFIPVVGEARYMQGFARAGKFLQPTSKSFKFTGLGASRGLIRAKSFRKLMRGKNRTKFRLAKGGLEGVLGAAAVEPLILIPALAEQSTYGWDDSIMNSLVGGALGASFHGLGGKLHDRFFHVRARLARIDAKVKKVAMETGISDYVQDRPITSPAKVIEVADLEDTPVIKKRKKKPQLDPKAQTAARRVIMGRINMIQQGGHEPPEVLTSILKLVNDGDLETIQNILDEVAKGTKKKGKKSRDLVTSLEEKGFKIDEEGNAVFGKAKGKAEQEIPGIKNPRSTVAPGDIIEYKFGVKGQLIRGEVTGFANVKGKKVPVITNEATGKENVAAPLFLANGRIVRKKNMTEDIPGSHAMMEEEREIAIKEAIERTKEGERRTDQERLEEEVQQEKIPGGELKESDPDQELQDALEQLTADEIKALEQELTAGGDKANLEKQVNSMVEAADEWAKGKIKDSMKKLSMGIDPELVAAYIVRGTIILYRAVKKLLKEGEELTPEKNRAVHDEWQKNMEKEFGDDPDKKFQHVKEISRAFVEGKIFDPRFTVVKEGQHRLRVSAPMLKAYRMNQDQFSQWLDFYNIDIEEIGRMVDEIQEGKAKFDGGPEHDRLIIRGPGDPEFGIARGTWLVEGRTWLEKAGVEDDVDKPWIAVKDGFGVLKNKSEVQALMAFFEQKYGNPNRYYRGGKVTPNIKFHLEQLIRRVEADDGSVIARTAVKNERSGKIIETDSIHAVAEEEFFNDPATLPEDKLTDGFITSKGEFLDRKQAESRFGVESTEDHLFATSNEQRIALREGINGYSADIRKVDEMIEGIEAGINCILHSGA